MSESAFAVYTGKHKKSKKKKRSKNGKVVLSEESPKLSKSPAQSSSPKAKKRKIHAEDNNGDYNANTTTENEVSAMSVLIKKNAIQAPKIQDIVQSNDSISKKATKLFKWLLHPMNPATFFEDAWEKQPIFISRGQSDYFKSILTSSDIDTMLREHPLYFGRNVDVVIYNDDVRETVSPEGRARPSIVWDAYSKGCSVRILNPQTYNDTVHFILATLQEYFGTMVGANVYLTPAGSQGFAPHYDDIEAFIIQLEGKKHWKLYKPLTDSENLARFSSKDFTRDQLGDLIFEDDVTAGDILYFPRGFVHEARTDDDQHSLHITISTYQRTSYADLLEQVLPQALQTAAENDIEFRKGLPLNYLKQLGLINAGNSTPERVELYKTMQRLFIKMSTYANIDEAADKLGKKFMHEAMPPALDSIEQRCSSSRDGDQLVDGKLVNRTSITLDTEVRLTRYYACHMTQEENQGVLYFSTQNAKVYHGEEEQYITFDLDLGSVIELLKMQYPDFTTVRNLPHEDEEKVLDFIMQLWDYGIISTKSPLSKSS